MFDFISKLIHGRSEAKKNDQQVAATLNAHLQAEDKHKSREQERHLFLKKVEAAANDETQLIELLGQCDFADGRFQVAQKIVSQSGMVKVLPAMRKLDKRVAKLLQTRLDEISEKAQNDLAARACVAAADSLLQQTVILSNQLVDLDKQYALVKSISEMVNVQFQEKRQLLTKRLGQQIQLQQRILTLMKEIEQVEDHAASDLDAKFLDWQARFDACSSDENATSLPKHLLNECQLKLKAIQDNWRRAHAKSEHINELVSAPENINLGEQGADVPVRLMVQEKTVSKPANKKTNKPHLSLSLEQIEVSLQQMEAALEQGSVQNARQFDRELRDVDTKQSYVNLVLSVELKERLNLARKELLHLLSWAKWSGNASRDELVNTAEGLAGLKLSPKEIVGTVSALREQWKQTEASSGAATKELWTRFDTACNSAYAPAAQFFSEQSDQRQANLRQAESNLVDWQAQVQALLTLEVNSSNDKLEKNDWKSIASTIQQMQQSWRGLGHVDRKDKNRLDKEFDALLDQLRQPLAARQQEEIASREALILSASQLDSTQKSAVDQLRQLQQRWQIQAASLPLPRKDDQALWERFRAACDAVFEQKRANAESADKQRHENLQAKEKICLELQQVSLGEINEVQKISGLIVNAKNAWRQFGQVPRSDEQQIDTKFQTLLDGLQLQMQQLQERSEQEKSQHILTKLHTCLQVEALISSSTTDLVALQTLKQDWNSCTLPNSPISKNLQQKFDKVCSVLEPSDGAADTSAYQEHTNSKRAETEDTLLHLEILLGIDSPAELSRERLQKQVQVLQSSLKNGQDKTQALGLLNHLLCLPLKVDTNMQQRVESLFHKANLKVQ
nr:DUF349 domain-containing protein [uncultured Undibacterium sp.]